MTSGEPPSTPVWRTWSEIAGLFDGPDDPGWLEDHDRVEEDVGNPDGDHLSGA
jgi:hypothetical protein